MRLGWMEILLIVVLILLLFGANKFPGMMKNLADGVKVFKKEMKNKPSEKSDANVEESEPAAAAKKKPAKKTARKTPVRKKRAEK